MSESWPCGLVINRTLDDSSQVKIKTNSLTCAMEPYKYSARIDVVEGKIQLQVDSLRRLLKQHTLTTRSAEVHRNNRIGPT